jgi:signal transduction histidine kinase
MTKLRSTSLFAAGFTTILVLLLVVTVSWIRTARLDSARLHSLVHKQLQTRLTATMLNASQNRVLSLYRMTTINDPFEEDDAYLQFRKLGEDYLKAREQILAGDLTLEEKQTLHKIDKLAQFGGIETENIAQLISDGQLKRALHLLNNTILPNRLKMAQELSHIFNTQRAFVEKELEEAANDHRYTNYLIVSLGTIASLLGVFTIFVVRRTRQTEGELIEQGERVRALYEASSTSGLSQEQQIRETLKLGCRLLGMEIGKVCHIDQDKNLSTFLHTVAPPHYGVKPGAEIPLDRTFCRIIYESDQPVMIHHMRNSEYCHYPCYEFSHLESYVAAPIRVNGEKFGTISFASPDPKPNPFTSRDKELIKLIANWTSVALERQIAQQINIARKSAEAANTTKSAFLANMSHELRTPLNAIIGYNELMKDEAEEAGDVRYLTDIDKINSASRHLLNLIDDILDLSKIESGKMQLHIEHFALKPLISELTATVTPLLEKNHNKLRVNCDNNLGIMRSDLTKLRQILINLLGNAGKFTENGTITLTVSNLQREDENWISFQISDTGIGISQEQLKTIFDTFSQADNTITSKYGGTGLGLAICKHLSELIGGYIEVESIKDVGSSFTVTAPMNIAKYPDSVTSQKANI